MSTNWAKALGEIPTFALTAELERRGVREAPDPVAVELPGLTVDPVGSTVVWRGDEYAVSGRQMEMLYVLAVARRDGRRWLATPRLGYEVFRGFDPESARFSTQTYLCYLRKRFPGLIESVRTGGTNTAHGLVLDEPVAVAGAA